LFYFSGVILDYFPFTRGGSFRNLCNHWKYAQVNNLHKSPLVNRNETPSVLNMYPMMDSSRLKPNFDKEGKVKLLAESNTFVAETQVWCFGRRDFEITLLEKTSFEKTHRNEMNVE